MDGVSTVLCALEAVLDQLEGYFEAWDEQDDPPEWVSDLSTYNDALLEGKDNLEGVEFPSMF